MLNMVKTNHSQHFRCISESFNSIKYHQVFASTFRVLFSADSTLKQQLKLVQIEWNDSILLTIANWLLSFDSTHLGGSTISALEIRRQKEEELRKNDQYWQTRLKQQEQDLKKTAAILEREYNETVWLLQPNLWMGLK